MNLDWLQIQWLKVHTQLHRRQVVETDAARLAPGKLAQQGQTAQGWGGQPKSFQLGVVKLLGSHGVGTHGNSPKRGKQCATA